MSIEFKQKLELLNEKIDNYDDSEESGEEQEY